MDVFCARYGRPIGMAGKRDARCVREVQEGICLSSGGGRRGDSCPNKERSGGAPSESAEREKFSDLAAKHSMRLSTAKKGGEIGWGTRATFGNLSEKFFAANPGDIVGPEFVDPYWGVFKSSARMRCVRKHTKKRKIRLPNGSRVRRSSRLWSMPSVH